MGIGDYLVILLVVAVAALCIRAIWKAHKRGGACAGCAQCGESCCGCSHCKKS